MQARVISALIALAIVLAFAAGWMVNGWRLNEEIAALQSGYDKTAADASEKARGFEAELRDRVATIDKLQKDLKDAQTANDSLRGELATGSKRVLVRASCPASGSVPGPAGAPSVDDGAGYAELDGQTASAMAGITGDGDISIRKLTALQKYVTDVCLAPLPQ
jgi:prophage endopeptidase